MGQVREGDGGSRGSSDPGTQLKKCRQLLEAEEDKKVSSTLDPPGGMQPW